MKITVYSSPGCFDCQEAKRILGVNDLKYKSIVIGEDITKEEFEQKYPEALWFPVVIADDDVKISGLPTFKKWMKHLGKSVL